MRNNIKLAVVTAVAVFTMLTALVTMQTIPSFAAFAQGNDTLTGNQTGNQTTNQSSQSSTPEQPVYNP